MPGGEKGDGDSDDDDDDIDFVPELSLLKEDNDAALRLAAVFSKYVPCLMAK